MLHLSPRYSMCFAMVINALKAVQGEELLIPSTDLWVLIFLGMGALSNKLTARTRLQHLQYSVCAWYPALPNKGAGCGRDGQQLHKRCTSPWVITLPEHVIRKHPIRRAGWEMATYTTGLKLPSASPQSFSDVLGHPVKIWQHLKIDSAWGNGTMP